MPSKYLLFKSLTIRSLKDAEIVQFVKILPLKPSYMICFRHGKSDKLIESNYRGPDEKLIAG